MAIIRCAASFGVIRAALKPRPPLVRNPAFVSLRSMSITVASGTPVVPLIVSTSCAGVAIDK